MAREIVLDTETTGIGHDSGHRVIEIGCVEVEDLLPTGNYLHIRVHPERDIDADATRVHGLRLDDLRSAPRFADAECVDRFLDWIGDAPLVAHNAVFDRNFLNMELARCGRPPLPESRWTCTLQLAQRRFPGMHNSLDTLCKRYRIDLSSRAVHGALIDTRLLALVYLELKGGKERALDFSAGEDDAAAVRVGGYGPRPRPLAPRSTPEERERHAAWVLKVLKDKALWLQQGLAEAA